MSEHRECFFRLEIRKKLLAHSKSRNAWGILAAAPLNAASHETLFSRSVPPLKTSTAKHFLKSFRLLAVVARHHGHCSDRRLTLTAFQHFVIPYRAACLHLATRHREITLRELALDAFPLLRVIETGHALTPVSVQSRQHFM